jgi:hypothetical protein
LKVRGLQNITQARRVLVTGSRGKSSVVRMLHAAFLDAGLQTYARITGVVPRELGPGGVRTIERSTLGHVEEMRWWLKNLPANTQAVVLENSAIAPDLQHLAGAWLRPQITVLGNTLPDHQEAWGTSAADAARALTGGIPQGGRVVLPIALRRDGLLMDLLSQRACDCVFAQPVDPAVEVHRATNMGLALAVVTQLGLSVRKARKAILALPAGRFDFKVMACGGAELALAFSVNDIASSQALFESLQWRKQDTRIVFNHRADRPARLRSFLGWLNDSAWRDVTIIGDRPLMRTGRARYVKIRNRTQLTDMFRPGERVFGCGNIAGVPLALVMD